MLQHPMGEEVQTAVENVPQPRETTGEGRSGRSAAYTEVEAEASVSVELCSLSPMPCTAMQNSLRSVWLQVPWCVHCQVHPEEVQCASAAGVA